MTPLSEKHSGRPMFDHSAMDYDPHENSFHVCLLQSISDQVPAAQELTRLLISNGFRLRYLLIDLKREQQSDEQIGWLFRKHAFSVIFAGHNWMRSARCRELLLRMNGKKKQAGRVLLMVQSERKLPAELRDNPNGFRVFTFSQTAEAALLLRKRIHKYFPESSDGQAEGLIIFGRSMPDDKSA